jgi:hypothetical protein
MLHAERWFRPLALAACTLALACDGASPERIERWKTAPDGLGKLTATVKEPGVSTPLRAAAAAALVEAGAPERMSGVLAGLTLEERGELIPAVVALLGRVGGASDARQAGDAREALYAMRELATTDAAKKSVDAALLPALEQDVRAGRERAGRYGVKEMFIGLKKDGVPRLLAVLEDPQAPFALPVEVIEKVGDAEARAQGGAALVKRATAADPVPEPLWGAMATLGGKAVVDFLSQRVQGRNPAGSEKAAETMAKLRRTPELLPLALQLAGGPATAPAVREHMFQVVERVGDEAARNGVVALVRSAADNQLRQRAFRAALTIGRGKAIVPALEAVPASVAYTPDELREQLVAPISAMPGLDSREGLFKSLQSPAPIARVVAVLALEKMGFASDAEHLAKLAKDKGVVKGFPRRHTVGTEATRAAAVLRNTKS